MLGLFREARFDRIILGNLQRFNLFKKIFPLGTGGTNNARYCYSVWMRHLYYYCQNANTKIPQTVAELGPGDSLGIGLTALLTGAKKYVALDVLKFWDNEKNIKIFDEILSLIQRKEPIPDDIEFPNIYPKLIDYSFPDTIINDDSLKESLNVNRIIEIRKELIDPGNPSNSYIKYQIPWYDDKVIQKGSLDFVFSQAVLEHVDDLENAYKAMNLWLTDNGIMSHAIDFRSHGMTKSWNGHWSLTDFEWKITRAGRVYAINRMPLSEHIKMLSINNFNILEKKDTKLENKLKSLYSSVIFQNMSTDDIETGGVYILAQKFM